MTDNNNTQPPQINNLAQIWPGLFRAIAVAKVGGNTLSVYISPDYEAGQEDYLTIKSEISDWFSSFAANGDIKVMIDGPKSYDSYFATYGKKLSTIKEEVQNAIESPSYPPVLSGVARDMLKNATERLGLSLAKIERIKQISENIRRLENMGRELQAYHVAEAIQYATTPDGYCAESKALTFGPYIKIALGDISMWEAQEAIAYLSKFIPKHNQEPTP